MLLPAHQEHLRESGLRPETWQAAGIYSETDPRIVSNNLGWERPATALGNCIAFPFWHLDGTFNAFKRYRPDHPRIADGKPVKYEQPRGVSPRAYFPPGTIKAINTSFALVGFTEGEKKALASDQEGFPCIGLCGIWSWTKPKSDPRELTDDLAAIEWWERDVWIAYDTDSRRNPNVNHARAELARVLTELGATVTLIDLPHGPRGET